MIKIETKNTATGEIKEYEVERFTTMRTRMTPYPGEAFDTDPDTTIVGADIGTIICKNKTGEVFYRHPAIPNDAKLENMTCKRNIK